MERLHHRPAPFAFSFNHHLKIELQIFQSSLFRSDTHQKQEGSCAGADESAASVNGSERRVSLGAAKPFPAPVTCPLFFYLELLVLIPAFAVAQTVFPQFIGDGGVRHAEPFGQLTGAGVGLIKAG